MPRPRATNTPRAMGVGIVIATPKEAPMNGAVQGEATKTANTPVRKWSTTGLLARAAAQEPGTTRSNSNRPSRFSPMRVKSRAKAATKGGDCS